MIKQLVAATAFMLLWSASFIVTYPALSSHTHQCTAEYTADYRYTFCFEDGTTLWTDMPPDFGYLDTMTCVYVGVTQQGKHFSRVCRPADQTILVTDKYAKEVTDPLR